MLQAAKQHDFWADFSWISQSKEYLQDGMTGPDVQSNIRRIPVFAVESVKAVLKRRCSINEHS